MVMDSGWIKSGMPTADREREKSVQRGLEVAREDARLRAEEAAENIRILQRAQKRPTRPEE